LHTVYHEILDDDFVFAQELYVVDFETINLLLKEHKHKYEDSEANEAVSQGICAMFLDAERPFQFALEQKDKVLLKESQ
jgi:hypothetical protein